MSQYYDRAGNPITMEAWVASLASHDSRRVASDKIGNVEISTVWLGLDHGWGGKPMIFETMIFGGEHDLDEEHYSTEAEAIAGHARAVALAKSGLQ